MTYLEHVTVYFVSLVGKGVTMSSRDLAIIRQWESAGLPAPVVCRRLKRAFTRRRTLARVSLADLAASVDRLLPPLQPSVSATPPSPVQITASSLLERVVGAGQSAPLESTRSAYRALYRALDAMTPDARLGPEALGELDDATLAALEEHLDDRETRREGRRVLAQARRLLGPDASDSAVDRLSASLLESRLCETHGLVLPSALAEDGAAD